MRGFPPTPLTAALVPASCAPCAPTDALESPSGQPDLLGSPEVGEPLREVDRTVPNAQGRVISRMTDSAKDDARREV